MIQALEIVARVVNNVEYSSAILHARKGVSEGMTLSQGLSNSPHFTPLVLHMLKVGGGRAPWTTCSPRWSTLREPRSTYTVDRLSSIIEPIMILGTEPSLSALCWYR